LRKKKTVQVGSARKQVTSYVKRCRPKGKEQGELPLLWDKNRKKKKKRPRKIPPREGPPHHLPHREKERGQLCFPEPDLLKRRTTCGKRRR